MSIVTDFFNKYFPDAQRASQATGINADVILAQAALESGYGQSAPGNNLFGIKGQGTTQTTQEFIGGKWVTVTAPFKAYASTSDSFNGYASFISGNRYSTARSLTDSTAQVNAIASAGYATDPNYAAKVSAIASKVRTQFSGTSLSNDPIGDVLRRTLPQSVQDFLGGTAADALKAPGDAIDGAIASVTPDLNSWFQRIAVAIFALIFIAAAVFAFKGGDAMSILSKAKGLA